MIECLCASFVQLTGNIITRVPLSTRDEMEAATTAATKAFPAWRATPITTRQRLMFDLHRLVVKHTDELAESIVAENGKTLTDAKGDVFRGQEVVEYTCGLSS